MNNVRAWDYSNKTIDRYTIAIKNQDHWDIFGMSEDPFWLRGLNQYSHTIYKATLSEEITQNWGTELDPKDLPQQVQKAIKQRM